MYALIGWPLHFVYTLAGAPRAPPAQEGLASWVFFFCSSRFRKRRKEKKNRPFIDRIVYYSSRQVP